MNFIYVFVLLKKSISRNIKKSVHTTSSVDPFILNGPFLRNGKKKMFQYFVSASRERHIMGALGFLSDKNVLVDHPSTSISTIISRNSLRSFRYPHFSRFFFSPRNPSSHIQRRQMGNFWSRVFSALHDGFTSERETSYHPWDSPVENLVKLRCTISWSRSTGAK